MTQRCRSGLQAGRRQKSARAPIRLPGRKWLIGTALAVLIFLAYLGAGYVLARRLIRFEATRWASRHGKLSLGLGPIKVNPFHLTVSIRDIRLAVPSGALLSLGRLYLAVSPLSLKKQPVYPPQLPPASATSTTAASRAAPEQKVRLEQARIRWLRAALRPTVRPSSETLATLGLSRARHLQAALLAHGIPAAKRVFLTAGESGAPWHGHIRVKLRLRWSFAAPNRASGVELVTIGVAATQS